MFKVNTDELSSQAAHISEVATSLDLLQKKLDGYSSSGDLGISSRYAAVRGSISHHAALLGTVAQRVDNLADAVRTISTQYDDTETAVRDGLSSALGIDPSQGTASPDGDTGGTPGSKKGGKNSDPSWFSQFIQNKIKAEGSVKSGKKEGKGKFLGVTSSGAISGGLLNGEASFKPDGEYNITKGEIHAGVEGKLAGSLAKGKIEGDYGVLHGDAKVEAGNGAVSGKISGTIMKNGKFRPQVGAEVSGKAAVGSGEANVRVGSEHNNLHGKASGDVLVAEAEAGFSAGVGGVSAKAKAGAYAAKGKLKGGLSFLGIKVEAGVEGYAGGVGGEAAFEAGKGKVGGKIGAGLGAGAGVEISIDFSGVGEGIKSTIDWWNGLGKKKK